jgi:flagellar biosynthesis protein FlhF
MTELLEVGFSGVLARRMTQDLKPDLSLEEGRKHVAAVLDSRLQLFNTDNDLVQRGGVYALVGPTGVGKTTTAAKLAARCVVRYGADRVALITTDGYRIGAHEQLRIYGRILGVPVHAVGSAEELGQTLIALKDKHMVLIDTVGMSQRDRMVLEQGAMLASSGKVKRLLLLNATSRGETLDDVIQAYGGEDISGCIISKIDETTTLAPAVDAIVRHGMPVAYLANGQRVPEDLHLPNRQYLLHRVFKQRQGNMAHRLKAEEIGMALAGHAHQQDKSVSFG